jgi:hypothetical protein
MTSSTSTDTFVLMTSGKFEGARLSDIPADELQTQLRRRHLNYPDRQQVYAYQRQQSARRRADARARMQQDVA